MYALVDCNNFYASCERVFQPALRVTPIVILSNNDGCVIARSQEAKELGIPMGAPAFKFQELFTRNNVRVFSSNFALYGDMSARVMSLLADYSPDMEIYSIDEAFLFMKPSVYTDLPQTCLQMRKTVEKGTGIPISVGVGATKTLAKVANRIAKKFAKRTNGVYIIDTEEKRIKALKWLKVEDVWGIGRRLAAKLNHDGVFTAYDFTQLDDEWIAKKFSVVMLRTKQELEGKSVLELDTPANKKSIATTRSFDVDYTTLQQLDERVVTFAVTCAEKLRKQSSECNTIMVFVHTNRFRKDQPQYSKNIIVQLPFSTNSSIEIAKYACLGLQKIFREGYRYKKAGVIVMDITPENTSQQGLFEHSDLRHKPLMRAVDKVNDKTGSHQVRLAAQHPKRRWKMRQEYLSARYTTSLQEIIEVKCEVTF